MLQLISATPSPYARKVRIALAEKGIPFQLVTEVPWDSTTQTPQYNPLEKLPVLILDNGKDAVYESHYILEYLELKYPDHPLLSSDTDEHLFARKVEVVADGICDALVLLFFERQRAPEAQSKEWQARQMRKVDGGLRALDGWVQDKEFMVGEKLGLADIAAACVCGYMSVRFKDYDYKKNFPGLARFCERLEERESFKGSVPTPQKINDKIV